MKTRLWRLIMREFISFFRDRRLMLVCLLVPLGYTLLLGSIYLPKRVSQIPTWVIDQDQSSLSRTVTAAIAQHEYFHITRKDGSLGDFRRACQRQQAFVCVIIPPHFAENIKWGRPARILTMINGDNMLIANSATKGITEIAATYSAGVMMKRLSMKGTPSQFTRQAAQPIESVTRTWYNPTYNYLDFLLPGLLAAVLQQIALLGIALAFCKERELNTFTQVLAISGSPLEIISAKSMTYLAINLFNGILVYVIAVHLFGLHIVGSIWLLALLYFLFSAGLTALGILTSIMVKTQLFATQILMLIAVPSFLLSGFTWPQMSMTPAILFLSNLLPLTHFVLPLRQLMSNGAGFADIQPHLFWLWSFTIFAFVAAYLALRYLVMPAERGKEMICSTE